MHQSERVREQRVLFYLVLIIPSMIFTSYVLDTIPFINVSWLKMLTQALILSVIIRGWLKFVLENNDFKRYFEFEKNGIAKIGTGVIYGLLAALVVVVIDNLSGLTIRAFNPALLTSNAIKVLLTSIIFFVSESYIEEMVTRGYVLEQFEEMHYPRLAIIFSSLVFIVVQFLWDNPAVNLLGWFNFYALGFLLGLVYLITKSKWLCIGFHTAWNLVFTAIFPAELSHTGHFANYVHMESYSTTFLLLILVAILLYRFEKQEIGPDKIEKLNTDSSSIK
ncbi:MAG: type II CAAX endopeptidase family protein [Firmicutes bacterium]|nr:type II CAAX endopeptidase family protein [Bacillota bacterium]MDD4263305.1 type II CAAX endopeptidase family protein [Bacillota bacterium]MDD4694232.1 type II CAAX endopeptidase family protein [Bacillota bacterium]